MDAQEHLLRRLKNQWKKERALLEQQNQLLSLNIIDLKDRAASLKHSNNALLHSIGSGRSSQLAKAQVRAGRLEEENRELRRLLGESSRERDSLASKRQALRSENSRIKSRHLRISQEKSELQQSHEAQLKRLELEFEKFRLSSDRLFDSFRSHVAPREPRPQERPRRPTAGSRPYSDASSVAICARCAEGRPSSRLQEECRHSRHSLSRSSVSSLRQRSPSERSSLGFASNPLHPASLADEIKRSLLETRQERATFGELLQTKAAVPKLETKHLAQPVRSSLKSEEETDRDTLQARASRMRGDPRAAQGRPGSQENRQSLASCFSALVRRSPQAGAPQACEITVPEGRSGEAEPGKPCTRTRLREVFRPIENWMDCSTADRRAPARQSASSEPQSTPSAGESSESHFPAEPETAGKPGPLPEWPGCGERRAAEAWARDKENSRRSCSRERTSANLGRIASVRESVRDCLSFNDLLKEKLAHIESKLKCKNPN